MLTTTVSASDYAGWQDLVRPYQQPSLRRALWQMVTSYGGLLLSLGMMILALGVSYALTLLLAVFAAGFLVRVFIIQHDCGHGSFFASRRANDIVGAVSGVLTMVPYRFWRKTHAIHHAHHAELEARGIGDVWTMTVREYDEAPWWKRAVYHVFRHPLFLFLVAPPINFIVLQRFPLKGSARWRTGEIASVWWTDLAIVALLGAAAVAFGPLKVLMIWLPMMVIASSVGTWLFYVQHQFERTYWEHTPKWDYTLAAMQGSSYYALPRVLQWFTGNIGFHHIHHLSPRIPNYNLQRCHDDHPILQRVPTLTIPASLGTTALTLWDEQQRRLVSFRQARRSMEAANAERRSNEAEVGERRAKQRA